ncbi:hypothetical protein J437_LFUL004623 [Ladona fulva]|uniref:Peptidase S1 domain-containing protein n=1 Tax=Ladona fulva TaxID=123851 RepID=A0A8K0JYD0_LADFU|nr:hypothetical protein J437_LFUL004623 [Ladona fulva]
MTDPDCDGMICSDMLQTFAIDEFIRYPQYDKMRKSGDIALIRLNRKAVFTEYVIPICLPSLETLSRNYLERKFIVAGWGATEIGEFLINTTWHALDERNAADPNEEISSEVKQWLRVPVVNNSRCAETLHVTMDETFMCAGTVEGEATCIGDSGGPLMMHESVIHYRPGEQWVVVAIVQGGTWICGTKGFPGLYTRVEPYIHWILDNIRP